MDLPCVCCMYSSMGVKASNGVMKRSDVSVFKRIGRAPDSGTRVCVFWLQGKCNRNPCRFLHTGSTSLYPQQSLSRTSQDRHSTRLTNTWKNPNCNGPKPRASLANGDVSGHDICSVRQKRLAITKRTGFQGEDNPKPKLKPCKGLVDDSPAHVDKSNDLHAQAFGNIFSILAKLDGHSRAITGIALPSDSSQLFSGSKDKSVRIWDCHSGQCASVIQFDQEIGCLVSEGQWVFVGLPNAIKAWNTQTKTMHDLTASNGQVYAISVHENVLFAGTEDGTIMVWKFSSADAIPEHVASLKGHSQAVFSLIVGADRLYSASGDNTVKMWDLKTLECLQTLHGHAGPVMCVLCWDRYLISGSLDNTIRVWGATESGSIEVVYEHKEESGIVSMCGMHDGEGKPILMCSCNDSIVRLYDLPSFCSRGQVVTNGEAAPILARIEDGGLLFTGDTTGQLCVWKLLR